MIINISSASQFQECRRKAMYYRKDRIVPFTVADPLLLGGAYHQALAHFFATDDMASAVLVGEHYYREEYKKQASFILKEELPLIERNSVWLQNSLVEFAKHYRSHDIQVIQPEVEFCVPLPDTLHHDQFFHEVLRLAEHTYYDKLSHISDSQSQWRTNSFGVTHESCDHWTSQEDVVRHHTCSGCKNPIPLHIQPHYFRGKTDAVVNWQGKVWLFEHKTEARTGDGYFTKFLLDFQPTGYLYGIQQSTGLRPSGFVLNIIKKPNAAFKGDPNTVIGFEREAYVRSDADLERFARDLSSLADDYEEAFFNDRKVYLNTKSCMNWNRRCDYMDICLNHGEYDSSRFLTRPKWDYVEKAYYEILGLPIPTEPGDLVTIQPAPVVFEQD